MTPAESRAPCSTISRSRNEPMPGTAPRADVWLLLTYGGPLGAKALDESDLPEPVKLHLAAELARIPHARLQLITPSPTHDRIEFFVVSARELDPFYRRLELSTYAELLELDLDAILSSESGSTAPNEHEPLYLVCTNGRRDPCCAQFGTPVFQALHRSLGDHVRQSSHVGGHRFAANVVLFPYGLCYGRIRDDQVPEFVSAGQQASIVANSLRGRSCYSPVVQAAEVLLRQEVGDNQLSAYRLRDEQQLANNRWNIEFEDPGDGGIHHLTLESFVSDERDRLSCWSDKLAPVTSYRLRSHAKQNSSPQA